MEPQPIKSFRDLVIYQKSYKCMLRIAKELLPLLPDHEKYDLKDQLSRSSKAIPRFIAEGYAKKHQKFGFKKYLDDAMAEINETIVSLEQAKDLYFSNNLLIAELIIEYDVIARQTFKLAEKWTNFR